jgi:hypothetical protein
MQAQRYHKLTHRPRPQPSSAPRTCLGRASSAFRIEAHATTETRPHPLRKHAGARTAPHRVASAPCAQPNHTFRLQVTQRRLREHGKATFPCWCRCRCANTMPRPVATGRRSEQRLFPCSRAPGAVPALASDGLRHCFVFFAETVGVWAVWWVLGFFWGSALLP